MSLPDLTHLQFLVIGILLGQEKAGRDIRGELRKQGVKKSSPAFYQLMARLEDAGYVKGWYVKKDIDGQIVRERRYKVMGRGVRAWEGTRDFYVLRSQAAALSSKMA